MIVAEIAAEAINPVQKAVIAFNTIKSLYVDKNKEEEVLKCKSYFLE